MAVMVRFVAHPSGSDLAATTVSPVPKNNIPSNHGSALIR